MDILETEEEQVEKIKKWIRENWLWASVVVVLSIALSVGMTKWRVYQAEQRDAASELYFQFDQAVASFGNKVPTKKMIKKLRPVVEPLLQDYESSTYASVVALRMTQLYYLAGSMSDAEFYSEWLYLHTKGNETRELAILQRAKLFYAQGRFDEALMLLQQDKFKHLSIEPRVLQAEVLAAHGAADDAKAIIEQLLVEPDVANNLSQQERLVNLLSEL